MRILIEEHKYAAQDVKDILHGIDALESVEGFVSLNYVGYFYNTQLKDCVFILPKVLLEDNDGEELVFGKHPPKDIINLDVQNPLNETEKKFIYEFAVWIYRTIVVFKQNNKDTDIVFHKKIVQAGKGRRKLSNTFLDILLALIQFNKDNQSFFFFILRNLHSGYNKINWTRTIGTTNAIVQDNRPVYLNPVNKKRQINFDEELLVIFFSILNYIGDQYGFPKDINCNFNLIKGKQFETYRNGLGRVRLQQIKYKYFSDKALELWELCYAFFDNANKVFTNKDQQEYLLVKNFNIVFEAIIDELIGDRDIPKGLKEQEDGKRVDHMYTYKGLTTHEEDKPIYYIGDSKYYKRGNQIGKESVYKQFTYARNVIQWHLNLFMDDENADAEWKNRLPELRDDVTEGYNVIPNFFISAKLNEELSYKEEIERTDRRFTHFDNRHFKNRLFDRDTLLVCHYDVNFLYVVSLYARNNTFQKDSWKVKVREKFRREIQRMLEEKYDFYAMSAHPGVDAEAYIKEHFQDVLGKIYSPYANRGVISLALDNDKSFKEENDALLAELEKYFYVKGIAIGENPTDKLEQAKVEYNVVLDELYGEAKDLIKDDIYVLTGFCKDKEHMEWILNSELYNIRTGTQNGSLALSEKLLGAKYLLLHRAGKSVRLIKLKNSPRIMTGGDLFKKGYPYKDSKERIEKCYDIYIVFDLDKENTEKVFESYSWDMKNLNLKEGHLSAVPQYISLAELVKRRNK
ncbi:MAG: restriction endonuclease [Parabacteroides sp.]|nr:restriction endonuclease [Parabacteroides sp.]